MKVLIVVALALTAMAALSEAQLSLDKLLLAEWNEFKATHGKIYESSEQEDRRFQIYLAARKSIAEHNYNYTRGIHTYRKAVNKLSDINLHEDSYARLKTLQVDTLSKPHQKYIRKVNISDLPKSFDWTTKGVVTPVKDQGQWECNSGWAFAITGTLESAYAIKTGQLIALSEKQLIDCSNENQGCDGGTTRFAYEYLMKTGGIESQGSYPYVPEQGECQFVNSSIALTVKKYVVIERKNEDKLMEAVATVGPVAVTINAMNSLTDYYDGVFSDPQCDPRDLNHGALLVGYDSDPVEGDFWILKNSWSHHWGKNGYFKLARNKNNMCGIASAASYPII